MLGLTLIKAEVAWESDKNKHYLFLSFHFVVMFTRLIKDTAF